MPGAEANCLGLLTPERASTVGNRLSLKESNVHSAAGVSSILVDGVAVAEVPQSTRMDEKGKI